MIAGRSGTQKSGFALWLTTQWNRPTLYFSADMSGFTASSRLASMQTGDPSDVVEAGMAGKRRDYYLSSLLRLNTQFVFGSPITWNNVQLELDAYVELFDTVPEVIVFDNLMDFENCESAYEEQMNVMASISDLSRGIGSTCIVLHHASDKTWDARTDPWNPPSRDQIKNGLAEKPELALSVALDPHSHIYRVAVIKQRMGPSDPTAQSPVTLRARPELTRFEAYTEITEIGRRK